jgi:hypothetical protein
MEAGVWRFKILVADGASAFQGRRLGIQDSKAELSTKEENKKEEEN